LPATKRISYLLAAVFLVVVLLISIGIGLNWPSGQKLQADNLALADEQKSLDEVDAIIRTGQSPSDWPVRAFIPSAILGSAAVVVKQAQIDIPQGTKNNGHVDGYTHIVISDAHIDPENGQIGVRLSGRVNYVPDLKHRWRESTSADVGIDGFLLPAGTNSDNGGFISYFKVVPNSIRVIPRVIAADRREPSRAFRWR
jgi:hypothetical protein